MMNATASSQEVGGYKNSPDEVRRREIHLVEHKRGTMANSLSDCGGIRLESSLRKGAKPSPSSAVEKKEFLNLIRSDADLETILNKATYFSLRRMRSDPQSNQ